MILHTMHADKEWVYGSPTTDTDVILLIQYFPKMKCTKEVWAETGHIASKMMKGIS